MEQITVTLIFDDTAPELLLLLQQLLSDMCGGCYE